MEIDTVPPASKPQRVQELWFEDGNLVIQAGNSQFRVYRGAPDSELVDGCPSVRLPDPATEVTVFLKAIFDPDFFVPFTATTTFDSIVGCLRLSHKYGVDYLRRRALIHLSSGHSTSLSEWDSIEYEANNPNRLPSEIMSWPHPDTPNFRLSVIQLAREVDALWILPIAFYRLSFAFNMIGSEIFQGAAYNGLPVSLSRQDQDSFVKGHTLQITSTNADILQFLSYPRSADIDGCESPARCDGERLEAIESSRELIRRLPSIPLDIWDWDMLQDVCPACLAVLEDAHEHARQAFWDKLPGIYALPSWEELDRMKITAMGNSSAVL
ncbi:hypothetical protein C8R44DRAFT_878604 [Mycena epipterygia]|nr:hypothetical protein C8R44DRAFT_878604 [Mycena epipterygia]